MGRISIRSLALAFCVALLLASALASVGQAAPKLPLSHAGRWITDARGRVVIVHGTNMVYKLAPYYPQAVGFGKDDAKLLASIGFNAVRVGVIWKAVEPQPGVYDDSYLRQIAATVKTLARRGIVSVLDFHQDMYNETFQGEGFPDWAVQDDGLPHQPQRGFSQNYYEMLALQHAYDHFWANSPGPSGVGLQDRYAAAWAHVAGFFNGNRNVLGYELMNEPFPGTQWQTCAALTGCPAFDALLTAFVRRVDVAIRRADPRTLVWYEPNVAFDFGPDTQLGPIGDGHAGFAFHDYCFEYGAAGSTNSCASLGDAVVTNALKHVAATGDALMMTEFGDAPLRAAMVARDDRYMVPWLEWAYCDCHDPTTTVPNEGDVLDPAKAPTGSNLAIAKLREIVEPYPQLIAGTPQSWGFDPSTRVFSFTYSTARAGAPGRFSRGWITEIAVPALVYAGRYAVRVSGGAIVSRRGAGMLRIAACRRARTIKVTVSPSGRSRGSCRVRARARRPRGSR